MSRYRCTVRPHTAKEQQTYLERQHKALKRKGLGNQEAFAAIINGGACRAEALKQLSLDKANGIEQALGLLRAPWVPIRDLVYICNETVSLAHGRSERADEALGSDVKIAEGVENISIYGRGRHEEFDPDLRGALGTFIQQIIDGVQRLSPENRIVYGINGSGTATRETPITQQEKGDKSAARVGANSLMQIVAAGCDLVAKQLPEEGEFLVLAAGDNAFAGTLYVGDHPLAEDKHGIINLTIPEKVVGKGIKNKDLLPLEQLGILLVNPATGARMSFEEKIPVATMQTLSKRTAGIVDLNSMIKIIRKDVAKLYGDNEHYMRPSVRNGRPLILAYAARIPDWSKLHDEPTVHSTPLNKWMARHDAKYERGDWRLLWIVANDIVLASLEKIALSQEYLGRFASLEIDWKAVNEVAISTLKKFGAYSAENNDPVPQEWYFARNKTNSLETNWKELFLAGMAIKYNLGKGKDFAAEWMEYRPDEVDAEIWASLGETILELDQNENGIAAGRIKGFWIDTGTKRELFEAWMKLVDNDQLIRESMRELCGIPQGITVGNRVEGKDKLAMENPDKVFVGGQTHIISTQGAKIHLGENVVIVDSAITWDGKEDLHIPPNTVIFGSKITEIDPAIQDKGATFVYRFNGNSCKDFTLKTPEGNKSVKFGFYGGVMFGSMNLSDGQELSTIFPLDLNIKGTPQMELLDRFVTNHNLRDHFKAYYADAESVLQHPVPFTGVKAAEILKNIGF